MSRVWWLLLVGAMAALLLSPGRGALSRPPGSASIPVQGPAPAFRLTDSSGRPFESAELAGRLWIADFIFTSCAGQCPEMSRQMASLQRRLPEPVRFVSISVDPERDSPAVLERYAREYGADPQRWRFLTGEPGEIGRLAKEGFRLGYADGGSPEEPIVHSARFILVDPAGRVRGYYDGTDPKAVERLARDVRALLQRNPSTGNGAG